jgi:hypothetical protein
VRVSDARRGAQQLKFRETDTARIAVLARAERPTAVTAQWWSPSDRAEACSTRWLQGGKVEDITFDVPVEKPGRWRVRVAFGDVIVLDETFYVTGK